MKVFISSTCYDLIDLRAELEHFFRQAGVSAILSDSLTSEFQVTPDQNSIETCLVNVRECDVFLIVLSKRYGPTLGGNGFPDVSATHLEYREAVKHKKAIYMYVRDHLEADYSIWKKNSEDPKLKLSWCTDPLDRRIFKILKEHRTLAEDKNNWLHIFGNSVELKARLEIDFREAFTQIVVADLFKSGRIPYLEMAVKVCGCQGRTLHLEIEVRNLGDAIAVSPIVALGGSGTQIRAKSLTGGESQKFRIQWHFNFPNANISSKLTYGILEGYNFTDQGMIWITIPHWNDVTNCVVVYELKNRQFTGVDVKRLISEDKGELS
jgi:hypothetical protein